MIVNQKASAYTDAGDASYNPDTGEISLTVRKDAKYYKAEVYVTDSLGNTTKAGSSVVLVDNGYYYLDKTAPTNYNIKQGAAGIDRIEKIINADAKIEEIPNPKPIESFSDSIEFQNVTFSYNSERTILNNVSFSIPKGSSVALVGQSGSGKTTIANLIPRFYGSQEGKILIDGIPINEYKLSDLRKLIGIVTQESLLFNDTVFNNIAFGIDNPDKEKVIEAAKLANAHDFIMSMEEGYDTNIGDQGGKLSGGQRQRLCIARAIMKNPEILILDEATSALDTESERLVQEALSNLMKDRTSLVIAHRLSTIKNSDNIIVMNEGRIVESGKHEELITLNGAYKRLHDLQLI